MKLSTKNIIKCLRHFQEKSGTNLMSYEIVKNGDKIEFKDHGRTENFSVKGLLDFKINDFIFRVQGESIEDVTIYFLNRYKRNKKSLVETFMNKKGLHGIAYGISGLLKYSEVYKKCGVINI